MVLACAPAHPLAGQRLVRLAQLDGTKYVGFDKGLVIRREVDRFLREHDVAVQVIMEFDNIENIKNALEVSPTVAILPEPTLRQEVAAGTLVALPLAAGRFVRPLGIIQRRQQRLGKNAREFKNLLQAPSLQWGSSASAAARNGRSPQRSRNGLAARRT